MKLFGRLKQQPVSDDSIDGDDDGMSPIGQAMSVNDAARKKQQFLLGGAAAIALVSSCWWIFGGDAVPEGMEGSQAKEIKVATGEDRKSVV